MRNVVYVIAVLLLAISRASVAVEPVTRMHPVAIMDFGERGLGLEGVGEKVSTILFARLSTSEEIVLVERTELDRIVDEAALNLSGMVNPAQAIRVGQLTGARLLVTGTIFDIDGRLMIVSKVIGTETGRVMGVSVDGDSDTDISTLATRLASKIESLVREKSAVLVAETGTEQQLLEALRQRLSGYAKPTLVVDIHERHINRPAKESAAEHALLLYGKQLGFEIVDKDSQKAARAQVLLTGNGFSEYTMRRGELLGVKARLEVKAVEQHSGKILAAERQSEMVVDVSEITAAKNALAQCADRIAQRMLPQLVLP